jgi:molybdopterin-biosynthesis enzyme MoeA-like protein
VLTSGGIGSTPDDVTMAAVAGHLGLELVIEPEIDHRISRALEWTARNGGSVTPAHEASMRKMSLVPDGAYLLAGARGVAPGVAVDVDGGCDDDGGATAVILPGIPNELQRIMLESIEPLLLAGRGEPQHVVELTHPYPESTLNPVFDRLVEEFPDVHLGSYPGRECIVRLKGRQDRVEAAEAIVRAELDDLAGSPGAAGLAASWAARYEG